jgi:AGZA family xanthine/uracil permease-like MFS transporter
VTALPYGINTVSLFAYVLLVMAPAKQAALADGLPEPEAAKLAWQIGLGACFLAGVLELAGSFVADALRRVTPRSSRSWPCSG